MYISEWKLSLRSHSCNKPAESSWHQEVRNHNIFCVVSNDATLWITMKLTRFTLFELKVFSLGYLLSIIDVV